jgi:hypothetical protein
MFYTTYVSFILIHRDISFYHEKKFYSTQSYIIHINVRTKNKHNVYDHFLVNHNLQDITNNNK